ncbi:MAG: TRAP transporter small permease [Deltaproteobacteria bacterium]|nr:TRAP transporter small permease [Deltaproteobacteria bacterium]
MNAGLFQRAGNGFDKVVDAFIFLGALILAFLMISVCWDVLARTFLGRPLTWVLEFTEYGLLYMTFLCTAWVLKNEGHVTSDLLLVRLSSKAQALLTMVTSILGAALCLLLTWYGASVSLEKLKMGAFQPTAIQPPDFPIFVIIPIGFLLLFIQFLRRTSKNYRAWKAPGKI